MYSGVSPFRWIWILAGILILTLLVLGLASAIYGLYLGQAPFHYGFYPFFGFGWLLIIILFAGFVLRLVFRPWRRGRGRFDPAIQALRERYARGDITKEQFMQMVRDLREHV